MGTTETPGTQQQQGWRRFILPVAWMVAIFFASDQPKLPSPDGLPGFDKLAHFGAYGLLATLWVRVLHQAGRPWRAALLGLAVTSLYGISDEFHQGFTPGRSVELADWVADTTGAAVAVTAYCFWPAYRALLDRRIDRAKPRSLRDTSAPVPLEQET